MPVKKDILTLDDAVDDFQKKQQPAKKADGKKPVTLDQAVSTFEKKKDDGTSGETSTTSSSPLKSPSGKENLTHEDIAKVMDYMRGLSNQHPTKVQQGKPFSTPLDFSSSDPIGDKITQLNKLSTDADKAIENELAKKKKINKNITGVIATDEITKAVMDAYNKRTETKNIVNATFPDANTANRYLTEKLRNKNISLQPKANPKVSDVENAFAKPQKVGVGNTIDDFSLDAIASSIDPQNTTERIAFDKYQKERNLNDVLKFRGISEDAALKYEASQNPQIAQQLDKLSGLSKEKYESFVGSMVMDFLYNPDVIEKARNNPELRKQWLEQSYNLYNSYPSLAKKIVSEKIGQAREDQGLNNAVLNIPNKTNTDKLVEQGIKDGWLSLQDKSVYEKMIRPKLGFWRSIGRGAGNIIAPALTNDAPISTPDFLGKFGESYKSTLRGTAQSILDVTEDATGLYIQDDKKRLANILQRDYSTATLNPKSFWTEASSSMGNFTGFVVPMIAGAEIGTTAGLSTKTSTLLTNGLIFEGNNRDAALSMFPDNPDKQYLYTALATGGDMFLGELLPTKEAAKGIKNALNKDITKVIDDFTENKITAAAAKKTLLDLAKEVVKEKVPEFLKGNTRAASIMSGFNMYHNALDAAFGGRDVSLDDMANEAVQSFKTGFLGAAPLTAAGMLGKDQKITGKLLREMAGSRDYYRQLIEDGAKIDPSLEATKNERIANLNDAALVNNELEHTNLTEPQKQKYLLQSLTQTIWLRRAEKSHDDVLKKEYEAKANEAKKIKESIYKGEDHAPEFDKEKTLKESNDNWKENIVAIDQRTDINDAEKEKLKESEDLRHAQEVSFITKGEKFSPQQEEKIDFTGKDNNFLANKEPDFFNPQQREQYNELMKKPETEDQAADMVNTRKEELKQPKVAEPEKKVIAPAEQSNVGEVKDALKDVKSTKEALQEIRRRKYFEEGKDAEDATAKLDKLYEASGYEGSLRDEEKVDLIAEDYHKAKEDGSNPQLVKAVEKLFPEKPKPTEQTIKGKANVGEVENNNLVDRKEVDNVVIPEGIEKEMFWQEKLVEHTLNELGIDYKKEGSKSSPSSYYRIKTKDGNDFKLRVSDHDKKYPSDGNVQYNEKTTPQEIMDRLRDEIPDESILRKQTINEATKDTKLSPEQEIIKKSIDTDEIKGIQKEIAKSALESPENATQFLKEVADQALNKVAADTGDPSENAVKVYGESIVNLAKEKFPKVEAEEIKLESVDKEPVKTDETVTEEPPPPSEPAKPIADVNPESEEWTAIRKEELIAATKLTQRGFDAGGVVTREESVQGGLRRLAAEGNPTKSLYENASDKVTVWADRILNEIRQTGKSLFNPNDEELAQMLYHRTATQERMAGLFDKMNSDSDTQRRLAIAEFQGLRDELAKVDYVLNETGRVGGRAFGFKQMEGKLDPEYGLQIRRMELAQAKGDKLTDEELSWVFDQWQKEQDLNQREAELKQQGMQEEFDKKMEDLRKEYDKKAKDAGSQKAQPAKEKTLSQKGKDIADKIRKLKTDKGTTKVDFTFGTWDLAIEGIAKLVEAGASIAEAIDILLEDKVIGFKEDKDRAEFEDTFVRVLGRDDVLAGIKENAQLNKVSGITSDMVAKNLIRDYVDSHIGEVDQKDILDAATEGLKEVLPGVTKEQLIKAYLKEDEFSQPTKKNLESEFSKAKRELTGIAKLEEDIEDLENLKKLRQRSFSTEREKSDAEKELLSAKDKLISDKKEREQQIKEDHRMLEAERNRQFQKVGELNKKIDNLKNGIREKVDPKNPKKDTPEIEALKVELGQADKDLREVEKEQRATKKKADDKAKKLAELDQDIKRLQDRGELLKRGKQKSPRQLDQDIEDKKNELKKAMNDKGVKYSNEDKFTKASNETRVKLHNDRIDQFGNKLKDKIQNGNLSADQIDRLTKLNNILDQTKIELNPNSKLSQKQLVENASQIIRKIKSEFERGMKMDDRLKLSGVSKGLQRLLDKFDSDKYDTEQTARLERLKNNIRNDNAERQRKLNSGEFEDELTRPLKKTDAELIKLQKQRNQLQSESRKKEKEVQDKNRSFGRKAFQVVRSAYVMGLIYKFGTMAKVTATSLLRPNIEALTKGTFGNIFKVLFPQISQAAKGGGESTSWRSIAGSYAAYFKQMGAKKMEEIYNKSNEKYEQSRNEYENYKKQFPGVENKELKDKMYSDMIDAQSNMLYQYIGGSSIQDAWDAFVYRSNAIEREFGYSDVEKFKGEDVAGKISYIINIIGRSHSAIKTFSGRANFAGGFIARLEGAVADGVDITKPDRILEIANESYIDWERGKYQQSNFVTDAWNHITRGLEKYDEGGEWARYSKAASEVLKFDVAITRVPVNIIHEAVAEYTVGAFRSFWKAAQEYRKAKKEVLMNDNLLPGTEEFKTAVKDQLKNMDKTEAALIARCFRKGGFGLGLLAFSTLTAIAHFGGFHHKGEQKKKESELGEDELNPGEIMFGDNPIGHLASKIIEHQPAAYATLLGLNAAKVYNDQIERGETTFGAAKSAIISDLESIQDAIPQTKVINPIQISKDVTKAALHQMDSFWEMNDVDEDGNLVTRKALNAKDELNLAIGRRGEVLTEENYKKALSIKRTYTVSIKNAHKTGASKEEISALIKERDELIENLYEEQKNQ